MPIVAKHNILLRSLLLVAAALVAKVWAVAQTDAQLSQYWAVPAYYNPAATGNTDFIHITAGSRLQWVGIKHAPQTFLALADMPFKFLGKRWGAGINLQQESIGLYKSINAGAQLSWKKNIFHGTLSIGLQVGIINETFDGTKTYIPEGDNAHNSNDDAVPKTSLAGTAFDMNAGIHFQHKWFWASLSSTHLMQPTISMKTSEGDETKSFEFKAGRVFYFMGGSNIPIKNTLFEIQPSLLIKTDTKFFQGEATARVRYKKMFSAGVGYRYNDAVTAFIGAEFKNFFLGYAFDYPTSAISNASSGSHEVFLGYNVKLNMGEKNKNKHKSIRIM